VLVSVAELQPLPNWETKLKHMNDLFSAWCKQHHHTPFLCSFTKASLGIATFAQYPTTSWKGSDTTLVLMFLEDMLRTLLNADNPAWLRVAHEGCRSLNRLMKNLYNSPVWMERQTAQAVAADGMVFLKAYAWLAAESFQRRKQRYPLRPKHHLFHHFMLQMSWEIDLQHSLVLNPMAYGCEADEDFVGKIARLSRRVHATTTVSQTIDRYLNNLYIFWR
jgi:hypothetical protein